MDNRKLDLKKFTIRLKEAVKKAGGNKAVAERSGVLLGTLNKYLRGVSEPSISKVSILANTCDVSVGWLLDGDKPMPISINDFDKVVLIKSIETVEIGLKETRRVMEPADKAELVVAVYDMLNDKEDLKTNNIVKLFKTMN